MANNVKFQDFSFDVKAAIDEETIAWLYTWGSETASQAARNCTMDDTEGKKLKGSYRSVVDEGDGKATIGSPMEAAFWEEWGTGTYAAHGDGRKGWWVFIEGQASQGGGKTYNTKEEAEDAARFLRSQGLDAYVTNGRRPNYTLEKAFKSVKPKAISDLEDILKRRLGK